MLNSTYVSILYINWSLIHYDCNFSLRIYIISIITSFYNLLILITKFISSQKINLKFKNLFNIYNSVDIFYRFYRFYNSIDTYSKIIFKLYLLQEDK